jgi:hypothetical protein
MLELTEDCDQVRVRNTLSPDKECWHDAWETLREKALIDSPRILTTHEVSSLLEAFDDHHHGKVHGSAIETVIRAVETFGVEKVAKRLEGLEEECNKKDSL